MLFRLGAVNFDKLTYREVLEKDLKVMDSTAASLCRDNDNLKTLSKTGVPAFTEIDKIKKGSTFVLSHIQGTPATMQDSRLTIALPSAALLAWGSS